MGIVSRPTQFSLRGLVWLVTAASVLAGVLVRLDLQQSMMLLASLFGGLFALPPALLVPSVLFARRWKWWTAFSLVAGSGAGAAMFFSMNRSWEATPLFLVPGLLTAAGLLLMRALGFRLWRPPRVLPSEALQAELLARDGAIAPNMPSAGDPEAKIAR